MPALVILAGGKSSRLEDKPFFKVNGKPMVKTVYESLQRLFRETVIVAKKENKERLEEVVNARIVEDLLPGSAALIGFYSGLKAVKSSRVFVVSCDVPFIKGKVVEEIMSRSKGFEAAVPAWPDNRIEPLTAFYDRSKALEACEKQLKEREYRLGLIAKKLDTNYLKIGSLKGFDPGLVSFKNINSVEDLKQVILLQG